MPEKIIGIAGWSGSGKSLVADFLVNELSNKGGAFKIDCFDLLKDLFVPGAEGHRQIVNYFGEEYLLKSGQLNQKKLWKFVYSDFNKLKILDYLLQPILINLVQNTIDSRSEKVILIENLAFLDKGWDKILTERIWIQASFEEFEKIDLNKNFGLKFAIVLAIQKRLYKQPTAGYSCLLNNSSISQFKNQLKVVFNAKL